ncbi:hypothetical protein AAG570_010073 [Ranatra chinensis]|uniref:Uncharacterized protein n=1 Tax=Ranatra chinensis TaxID=642074 RepID=A0ABD0YLP7_9HEMI
MASKHENMFYQNKKQETTEIVLFASINLQLHLIYIRGTLDEWHSVDTLEGLKLFGFFTFSISSGFFLWYIFYIAYMGAPIIPVKDSMAVTAVWIFMTANWCGCLYLCSKRYINILNDASRPLLSHI